MFFFFCRVLFKIQLKKCGNKFEYLEKNRTHLEIFMVDLYIRYFIKYKIYLSCSNVFRVHSKYLAARKKCESVHKTYIYMYKPTRFITLGVLVPSVPYKGD